LNRNGLYVGSTALLIVAFLFETPSDARWTPMAVFSVSYLTVFGTVVTFGLYFWLLRFSQASRLSLIAYVIPAVALLLGWTVGAESIGATTIAGATLILGGVWVAARR
jgi:drug/metabolite transporter (DMT)-like permease